MSQLEAKKATECGYWPTFRYNPDLAKEGKNPFIMDSKEPNWDLYQDFLMNEGRYAQLVKINPEAAQELANTARMKWGQTTSLPAPIAPWLWRKARTYCLRQSQA